MRMEFTVVECSIDFALVDGHRTLPTAFLMAGRLADSIPVRRQHDEHAAAFHRRHIAVRGRRVILRTATASGDEAQVLIRIVWCVVAIGRIAEVGTWT